MREKFEEDLKGIQKEWEELDKLAKIVDKKYEEIKAKRERLIGKHEYIKGELDLLDKQIIDDSKVDGEGAESTESEEVEEPVKES